MRYSVLARRFGWCGVLAVGLALAGPGGAGAQSLRPQQRSLKQPAAQLRPPGPQNNQPNATPSGLLAPFNGTASIDILGGQGSQGTAFGTQRGQALPGFAGLPGGGLGPYAGLNPYNNGPLPYGGGYPYGGPYPYGGVAPYGGGYPYGGLPPYGAFSPYGGFPPYGMTPLGGLPPYAGPSPYGFANPYPGLAPFGPFNPYSGLNPYAGYGLPLGFNQPSSGGTSPGQ
jgi:hypothetical protein